LLLVNDNHNQMKTNIFAVVCERLTPSQAARQGLAVLISVRRRVLKHGTSIVHQISNFISINLKLGVGNYVREVTSSAKVGLGPMSGRDATRGQRIRVQ